MIVGVCWLVGCVGVVLVVVSGSEGEYVPMVNHGE